MRLGPEAAQPSRPWPVRRRRWGAHAGLAARRSAAGAAARPTAALLALLLLAGHPPRARAGFGQAGDAPTRGVLLPGASTTQLEDAAAVEINPAQSAWLRAWHLTLAHTELSDGSRYLGTGTALFGGVRVPLLPLHLSLGLQVLRPARGFGERYPTAGKLSLGLGLRASEWLALGLSGHVFVAPGAPAGVNGLATLDAGATLRPARWLSLALVARDLTNPTWAGLPLQRRWDLEVGLRPLGSDALGLAVGVNIGERRQDVAARLVVQGRLYPGLTLFADATWRRRDLDDTDGTERLTDDVRVTAGLQVSFAHWGLGAAFVGGAPLRPGSWAAGGSVWLHARATPRQSVLARRGRTLLVDLPEIRDTRTLLGLLTALHRAARAPGVRAVILKIGAAPTWAHADELRAAVAALRRAGRRVVAYLYATSTTGYYVAAAAERIYLFPGGGIRMAGLRTTRYYVKALLDRLGIRAQFIRFAEYKTAPEPALRSGPSKEAAEVRDALLDEFSARLYRALARRPKIASPHRARALLDQGPFTAAEALSAGLVDALVWPDKLPEHLRKDLGLAVPIQRPRADGHAAHRAWRAPPVIAVLAVEGDIVDGRSRKIPLVNRRLAGAETLVKTLAALNADPRVRAIVLRVESGGGSALGSEAVWRVIRQVARRKPVIASLGNVAASGGYFMAVGAHRIYASPSSLTGSIGIFSGKADLSGLLAKLGIRADVARRGRRADADSWLRPYTPAEERALRDKLRYYYHRFLDAVAAGRAHAGLGTRARVAPLAKGRLWSGAQAHARRLVDRMGGLWEAIQEARRRAGLPADPAAYRLVVLPKAAPGFVQRALRLLLPTSHADGRARERDPLLQTLLRPLGRIPACLWTAAPSTPLARLPYEIEIR